MIFVFSQKVTVFWKDSLQHRVCFIFHLIPIKKLPAKSSKSPQRTAVLPRARLLFVFVSPNRIKMALSYGDCVLVLHYDKQCWD